MHSKTLLIAALAGVGVAAPDHLAARAATNTALQTTFPKSSGTTNLAAARTLAAGEVVDGGMKQWDRSRMSFLRTRPHSIHTSSILTTG